MMVSLGLLYGQHFNLRVVNEMDTTTQVEVENVDVDLLSEDIDYLLDNDYLLPCKLGDFAFTVEPLIRVSGSNVIKKTKVANLPGTVKEHISQGDFKITLRGMLINTKNELPTTQIKELLQELTKQDSLPINSAILRTFGITKVVVDNYIFPEDEGLQNAQTYIIELTSDYDYDLVLS